ncbi:TIGR03067 domain-containing protein [Bremerella cremea]|uniref:TIGR03067 domain-containing protein n=1 Tax=Bremerella cremea TaxID=1031537 RepID=A0A368KQG3_9BACT|nr:TIGR03067 domain-containing protein [Bremerella cremea]RCS48319.1 TIGR03067 domain-containing protein [Bremerella cremea]
MALNLAMLMAVGALFCADVPPADTESDRAALQGVWLLSSGEADGKALPAADMKDGKLVIDGDRYTFSLDTVGTLQGTQHLGELNGVKTIDITDKGGDHKDNTCLGIYEVEGDEFRVVFSPPGEPRPDKFETTPGSGQWMHVWKHVKD